jgi:predicted dehydrogenase
MRFALLGDHPDGLDMTRALAASGRHALVVYSGPAAALEILARDGLTPPRVGDVEEALANPAVEAVIVAGPPSKRAAQLRRALQSEHHVLCVHPVDPSPDVAYEAAMLQSDTRRVLLPLLPEALHPGVRRFAELIQREEGTAPPMLDCERWFSDDFLLDATDPDRKPGIPGWDVLRFWGGEIAEVVAMAPSEELLAGEPLALSGRFVRGGLWKMTLLPEQTQPWWRCTATWRQHRTELIFPTGWPGPAKLATVDDAGQPQVEEWAAANPWAAMVEEFEEALEGWRTRRRIVQPGVQDQTSLTEAAPRLGWLDAIRALELDDAVRRSVQRRRAYSLDFQEATEEASFKGAMTLVGCSLLWLSLLMLILSVWIPSAGWLVLPIFGFFLILQFLRWAVPEKQKSEAGEVGGQRSEVAGQKPEEKDQAPAGVQTKEPSAIRTDASNR